MNYEIEDKVINNLPLTEEETHNFLKYFCNYIRTDNGIIDPMDSNCKVCKETSQMFGRIMLMVFGCDVELLDIKKELNIPLTHYSNIIFINVDGKEKAYLVDMTYSQFFGESITLDDNRKVNILNIQKNIENEEFVIKLRKDGFVELTEEIMHKYIDYFLTMCKIQSKNIAYENINNLIFKRIKENKVR